MPHRETNVVYSYIHTKHKKCILWTESKIFKCQNLWCIKKPLDFRGLKHAYITDTTRI